MGGGVLVALLPVLFVAAINGLVRVPTLDQPPLRLAVAIPNERVLLCAPPKVGSTMTAWITLRLGGAEARCICKPHLCTQGQAAIELRARPWFLWHIGTMRSAKEELAPETIAYVENMWRPTESAAHWQNRRGVFGPESAWTRVLFTRDPWTRAISAYRDQLMRHLVKGLSPTSRDDFVTFTRQRLGDNHHTAAQGEFCGIRLDNITYTQAIDVDHGWERDWAEVIRARPDLERALTTGWEECTADGSASIVADNVSKTTAHQDSHWKRSIAAGDDRCAPDPNQHLSATQLKALVNDCVLCNETVATAVAQRYREDVRLLRRQGARVAATHVCAQHYRHRH
jgi:hypothetical protein